MSNGKFPLGKLVATVGAIKAITAEEASDAICRHHRGDWGIVGEDDRLENELSLKEGFRLFSVYMTKDGARFWIITEADRSATTVLLPEEY
jgi:hypothetical protein